MKSTFLSRTKINCKTMLYNADMIHKGRELYIKHFSIMKKLNEIDNSKYIAIPNLYEQLNIFELNLLSKRKFYESYKNGVIIGAGSGDDCIDIIKNKNFILIDLLDKRMKNYAVGYENSSGIFNSLSSSDGDTLSNVASKYKPKEQKIEIKTIDSLKLKKCQLISMDVEGLALDVLEGSRKTIEKIKPDLFISIYHNWIEYLTIIPMLYDYGYNIECVKTANFIPSLPHLELTLSSKYKK